MITFYPVVKLCWFLHCYFAGKRAETVRQILQDVLEQAEWKQPAVVLLDDLDHVTGAAASPEHEHGPEAALQQHIAQSKTHSTCSLVWF